MMEYDGMIRQYGTKKLMHFRESVSEAEISYGNICLLCE